MLKLLLLTFGLAFAQTPTPLHPSIGTAIDAPPPPRVVAPVVTPAPKSTPKSTRKGSKK